MSNRLTKKQYFEGLIGGAAQNNSSEDRRLGATVEGAEYTEDLSSVSRRRPTDDLKGRAPLSVSEEELFELFGRLYGIY